MIFNMTNGGGRINLSVTKYNSVSSLPSTEKENAISVITNTEITNYIFSDKLPSSPSIGTVWFNVSEGSVPIIMDRKETIILYPKQCR